MELVFYNENDEMKKCIDKKCKNSNSNERIQFYHDCLSVIYETIFVTTDTCNIFQLVFILVWWTCKDLKILINNKLFLKNVLGFTLYYIV